MKILLLFLLTTTILPANAFSQSLNQMAAEMSAGIKGKKPLRIAVLEFAYPSNKPSDGPEIIQERITTALSRQKIGTIVERHLLDRVLGELKLQASGIMDDKTIKKIGKVLGADAVVVGTLNDTGKNKTEINARLVDAETAEVIGAGSAEVTKTWGEEPDQTTQAIQIPPEAKGLMASKLFMDARMAQIRKGIGTKIKVSADGRLLIDNVAVTPDQFNDAVLKTIYNDLKAAGLEIPPALESYGPQKD